MIRAADQAAVRIWGTNPRDWVEDINAARKSNGAPVVRCKLRVSFVGRIVDTRRDPIPIMKRAAEQLGSYPKANLIRARPRGSLNIFQADAVGYRVISDSATRRPIFLDLERSRRRIS